MDNLLQLTHSDKQMIEKHTISMYPPLLQDDNSSECKFILIRHGFSQHNLSEKETLYKNPLKDKEDPRYKSLHMNINYIDTPLHPIGVQQCVNQQQCINSVKFHTVFVSPLQRTLETCIHLFALHPLREQIKYLIFSNTFKNLENMSYCYRFVVMPQLFECLCSSGCFAPSTLSSTKEKISLLASKYNIKLDYTQVEQLGRYWQIRVLEDKELARQILTELGKEGDYQEYQRVVFDAMERSSSYFLETWQMLFERTRTVIKMLKDFQSKNLIQTNEKIGVISHGFVIKCLTASNISFKGRIEDGIILHNTQMLPYDF